MSTNHHQTHIFKKGDNIEVHKTPTSGDSPAWFPATIINTPSPSTATLHVKYTTLSKEKESINGKRKRKKLKEYVDVSDMRPAPSRETRRRFVGGETVEVYYEKGWRKGKVLDAFLDFSDDGLRYKVLVGGLEIVVEDFKVRVFEDWKLDSCHDQQQKEEKSPRLVLQSRNGTKLRIICSSRTPKTTPFEKGTCVEVRSHEEGYHGSWYTAKVVGPVDEEDKLMVQYDTLTTDDQTKPLVEMAFILNIRPLPPIINRIDRFKLHEEVDVWYNDGWWSGLICKVIPGLSYLVYFWTTTEELVFEHSNIRPHQELLDGKWVASFLRPKVALNPRPEKVKLQMGQRTLMVGLQGGVKVEIAHGEKGFLTTWYPAVIVKPVRNGNYIVEYRTLTTKNGRECDKEEVDVFCIRPCPPIVQRPQQFQVHDKVEAWDLKSWQIGHISRTMKDFKYEVSFEVTNTVAEFRHSDLRPHQTFINGEWLLASKDALKT
uniref:protein AGENET DOMAIN (AGD)-CONTAINING P1-like n=1 Tax=Erigeron canadensis TaxID=72917 RepID=UPI001CB95D2C|nr:protein AGENET DOMAIN (AGD)-CONTAINING P1-like [Erigeron canadensis]